MDFLINRRVQYLLKYLILLIIRFIKGQPLQNCIPWKFVIIYHLSIIQSPGAFLFAPTPKSRATYHLKLYPHRASAAVARSIEMHCDAPKWVPDPFSNSDAYLDVDARCVYTLSVAAIHMAVCVFVDSYQSWQFSSFIGPPLANF